jgi:hypothetical protein
MLRRGLRRAAAAALAVAALASGALAGAAAAGDAGTLTGRIVTFRVLAYDDPAKPLFDGHGQTVKVSDVVEFGLGPEGAQNGLDVIPVQVNISDRRIEVLYEGADEAAPLRARFNGYVLSFDTDCVLFEGARVDPAATTVALSDSDVTWDRGTLFINVVGARYVTGSRFAVDLDVTDCPLS